MPAGGGSGQNVSLDIVIAKQEIAAYFEVPETCVGSRRQDLRSKALRQVLCWLCLRQSGGGFSRVPMSLGLHPQTVHTAFATIELRRSQEPRLKAMLDELEERARGRLAAEGPRQR
jgi:hypothetical protein